MLSACVSRSTPAPDDPVSSNDPTPSAPDPNSLQPQPNDDQFERGTVEITGTEIFTLESFPPQFMVNIEGSKATPCHQLRAVIGEPGDSKDIRIDVYTVFHPDAVCVQMIENFNVNLPLGSYAAGTYTVYVNEAEIGQITAP
ncbi:hypothetical protein FDZ74_16335 [bacterium]|nr:MAG: hypothetical protein FDZ74_16335 [bacterium]